MLSKQKIKRQINNITHIAEMLYSTELVGASRLRRSQARLREITPYCDATEALLRDLISGLDREKLVEYPLLQSPVEANKNLLVVVGGERGLCGGYVTSLVKMCEKYTSNNPNCDTIVYGSRTGKILLRRNFNIINVFPLNPLISFSNVESISNDLQGRFLTGRYKEVDIVYVSPKSAFISIPNEVSFIPIGTSYKRARSIEEYIIEPSPEVIIRTLLPMTLTIRLYRIFLEAITAEYSARRIAMHQAYENAKEILKKLNITYQELRQGEITTEIVEVSTSKAALEEGIL
ncbi:MAG: F0F1 ATP synthase subunit gamma [bacterium]